MPAVLDEFCYVAANNSISGLVVEYIVAIDVTRVRFPADAISYIRPAGVMRSCRTCALRADVRQGHFGRVVKASAC